MKSKHKILFITSFYSGLRDTMFANKWYPTGMPAIYKLLEQLEKQEIEFDYIFISQNNCNITTLKNNRFPNANFYIIGANLNKFNKIIPGFLIKYYRSKQISKAILKIPLKEYDLLYFDRATSEYRYFLGNNLPKTILRLHGVGKLVQDYNKSFFKRLKSYFKIKGFSANFDQIIASNDGTPVDKFLRLYTNIGSPKIKLLNGVDLHSHEISLKENKIITFLFVGRLEEDKGIVETINSFANVSDPSKNRLIIVGDGKLKDYVKAKIINIPNIEYVGNVSHKEITKYYLNSDIFISLNYLGNISNVVLEAINFGLGIITFNKNDKNDQDIETHKFLGDNAYYVDRLNIENSLENALYHISASRILTNDLRKKVILNLKPHLKSWDERIKNEINIIRTVLNK